jgi:Tol biopolymer transport system component
MSCRRLARWLVSVALVAAPPSAFAQATAKPAAVRSQRAPAAPKLKVMYNQYQSPVMSLFIADADGSNEHPLLSSPGLDYSPSYSADGKWIAFSSDRDTKPAAYPGSWEQMQSTGIYIVAPDGSGLRRLTHKNGVAGSPAWSPKGDEIALSVRRYFRRPGPPPGQIALMKSDGSDFRVIVDDSMNNGFASWSPDGSTLVFKRGHQLVTMSLADRKIVPLTDGKYYDNFPQWSPKGGAIRIHVLAAPPASAAPHSWCSATSLPS